MMQKKKIAITILKIVVILIAWIYVGFKINEFKDSFAILKTIKFTQLQIIDLILVFILMTINWSIEAKKWQYSIRTISHISFKTAIKAVFMGTTIGIISPNRAGEPFGRVSVLEPQQREAGASAGVLCSVGQFTSTIIAGLIALPFFLNQLNPYILGILVTICILLVILLYLKVNRLGWLFYKTPFIKRFVSFISHFQNFTSSNLLIILILSSLRYVVFLMQFYLILKVFGIDISFPQSCIAIGMIYLVTTLIPTTTLAELGVRCSSSVYFIGLYCNKPLLIIVATMALWLINVAVPAIIGSLFYIPFLIRNK